MEPNDKDELTRFNKKHDANIDTRLADIAAMIKATNEMTRDLNIFWSEKINKKKAIVEKNRLEPVAWFMYSVDTDTDNDMNYKYGVFYGSNCPIKSDFPGNPKLYGSVPIYDSQSIDIEFVRVKENMCVFSVDGSRICEKIKGEYRIATYSVESPDEISMGTVWPMEFHVDRIYG